MVSFQRNPNGGFRSSAARIVDAAKIRKQNVIKTRDIVNRRRRETLSDVVKFSLLGNTLVLFFVKIFLTRKKNKVQIFPCRCATRFLISSQRRGRKAGACE